MIVYKTMGLGVSLIVWSTLSDSGDGSKEKNMCLILSVAIHLRIIEGGLRVCDRYLDNCRKGIQAWGFKLETYSVFCVENM